jgi:hypothetical protein
MTKQVVTAIQSAEFKSDLKDYLRYGANIKLEKLIAFSLCKTLSKAGHEAILEKKKVDISLPGCTIEMKFHYDFDILLKVPKELKDLECSLLDYHNQLSKKVGSKSWMIMYGVLSDIFFKQCNLFIWIVSERDLPSYKRTINPVNICFVTYMENLHKCRNERNIDSEVRKISDSIMMQRVHKFHAELISFEEPVVSKVHFFIFDFVE